MNDLRFKLACVAFGLGVVGATLIWSAGEWAARRLA